MNEINAIFLTEKTTGPLFQWRRGWRLHWSLTLPVHLLYVIVMSTEIEVAILIAFKLSENASSPWVVSKILHDPVSTYNFSFNSFYSSVWSCAPAIYVTAYAISSVTYPLFAFICWVTLTDLLKRWFLMWLYTSFLSWAKCFSCKVLPHPLPALIITELCVYWSHWFHHETWDPLDHVCSYLSIPKAEHDFWFITDFNRKQRISKKI